MPSAPIPIPSKSIHAVSLSPQAPPLALLPERLHNNSLAFLGQVRQPKVLHPIDNGDLRILLLENISQDAVKSFQANGWQVDHHTKALNEDDLVQKIGEYHAIGIRSKTKITERVIKAASKVYIACKDRRWSQLTSLARIVLAPRYRVLLHRRKPS
jgi:D-3-phosphoglycerate dehydrogenase / 2-oxoglutarate reductase